MAKSLLFIFSIIISAIFWCGACSTDKRHAGKKEAATVKSSGSGEAELLEKAVERGNEISALSQKALASKLKNALDAGGVSNAIEFCNLNAYPIIDSLEEKLGSEIRRVTAKSRNPNDNPDSMEHTILDAYQNTHNSGEDLRANVQLLRDSNQILYSRAIVIENNLCLVCHGVPGRELTVENYELIKSFYPEDKAVGYQIGDLRGMWSIRIPIDRL